MSRAEQRAIRYAVDEGPQYASVPNEEEIRRERRFRRVSYMSRNVYRSLEEEIFNAAFFTITPVLFLYLYYCKTYFQENAYEDVISFIGSFDKWVLIPTYLGAAIILSFVEHRDSRERALGFLSFYRDLSFIVLTLLGTIMFVKHNLGLIHHLNINHLNFIAIVFSGVFVWMLMLYIILFFFMIISVMDELTNRH